MSRTVATLTQLRTQCGRVNNQTLEFDNWLKQVNPKNIVNISEYAEYDIVGKQQRLWNRYQNGQPPWDLIMYSNNTKIINLAEVLTQIDQLEVSNGGTIYIALNKWCVTIPDTASEFKDLIFDEALPNYVREKLKNYTIDRYTYFPNDRGGIGNWVHGNNRFWLKKK